MIHLTPVIGVIHIEQKPEDTDAWDASRIANILSSQRKLRLI